MASDESTPNDFSCLFELLALFLAFASASLIEIIPWIGVDSGKVVLG